MTASRAQAYVRLSRALRRAAPGTLGASELARIRHVADDLVLAPEGGGVVARDAFADLAEMLSDLVFDERVPDALFAEMDAALLGLGPSRRALVPA